MDSRDVPHRDGHFASPSQPVVSVRSLVKRYGGRAVVDGIDFEVQHGEVFALLGPNGAGKTTTVEILEGYRRADGGEVRVLGLDPQREGGALKRHIGLMLQQGGVYPQLTPLEALRLFASFYDDAEDPASLLKQVGLQDAARTRFRRLSGGQKQRLGLALALLGKPELVFLDEPTSAMDPQARRATWDIIHDLKQRGVTVLLTTHFMDEAEHLADRVAILDHGKVVALDTPTALRRGLGSEIRFQIDRAVPVEPLEAALGVGRVEFEPPSSYRIQATPTPALIATLTAALAEQQALILELRTGRRSLEEVFLDITSRTLEVA